MHNKRLLTGFTKLDNLIGGLKNGELIAVVSKPCIGKTTFALNIAKNIAVNQKIPVLIFSLEMSSYQLTQRILCSEAEISLRNARTGNLSSTDWEHIAYVMDRLNKAPILIESCCESISEIIDKSHQTKRKYPELGFIIIDYLQYIDCNCQDRHLGLLNILTQLKKIAVELNIPILITKQFYTRFKRIDAKPKAADLLVQKNVIEHFDTIFVIRRSRCYRKSKSKSRDKATITIIQLASGTTKEFKLTFNNKIPKFENS